MYSTYRVHEALAAVELELLVARIEKVASGRDDWIS